MTQIPNPGEEPATHIPPESGELPVEHVPIADPPPRKRRRRLVLGAILLVVLLLVGVGTVIFLKVNQKTAMEQAYENCNSSKALTRVFEEALSDGDGGADVDGEQAEESDPEDSALAPYFDGVLKLEDDGTTLIVSTLGQDDDPLGLGVFALECINIDLETPQWVHQSVQQTRSLDGRQTAEWGIYSAQWSYHPDNGLNMIITTK